MRGAYERAARVGLTCGALESLPVRFGFARGLVDSGSRSYIEIVG